ncbi:MAG: energy-coupling factor transporter ATPase [Peptococcaceae bacterium]|nr:energy-coupling factor transporter ATPase [Peptococcaceae bacterium]
MIEVKNVSFSYNAKSQSPLPALSGVSLSIGEGEFVAVLGQNGSGKSTLAKHLNGILLPTVGDVVVDGINTKDKDARGRSRVWEVRRLVSMVFQNPDNQIVATVVEDDVAFGPENIGVPPAEIEERITEAMSVMGILDFRKFQPHMLSAGQKQRVAIAGALAMQSKYIILDEPTSMLDPAGRHEVMEAVLRLRRQKGITFINITHFMDEAVQADRVVVMNQGRVVLTGTPREVFQEVDLIRSLTLDVPVVAELASRLRKRGIALPGGIFTVGELVNCLVHSG